MEKDPSRREGQRGRRVPPQETAAQSLPKTQSDEVLPLNRHERRLQRSPRVMKVFKRYSKSVDQSTIPEHILSQQLSATIDLDIPKGEVLEYGKSLKNKRRKKK